jgi:hypothetical protein
MFTRQANQASAFQVPTAKGGAITVREFSRYPEIPAGWPNRATRRAVKQGRDSRLSGEWRQVLAQQPALRQAIRAL